MARCPNCGGYLKFEREVLDDPARYYCINGCWSVTDPKFRKEEPRYFPPDRTDKRIEWRQRHPGYLAK
jgi:hypothetical protein